MSAEAAKPLISVIIPTYQHARDLPACLDSVFTQTLTDYEVIVVNDGSTDNTDEVVKPYLDRIDYIKQENRGGNAARNRGFQAAQGQFLFFCDADLILKPIALERLLATLQENPATSYAYCSFRFGWHVFKLWPFDGDKLRQVNYIHTSSLIRRDHFPGFDESIRRLQDWDLWLTMLTQGRVGVWVPEVLFKAIPHEGGISTWLPGIFYRIPWRRLGIRFNEVEKYQAAAAIIKAKHRLE
jgi:glycosyltransferase involved in cell wall biosynthesis